MTIVTFDKTFTGGNLAGITITEEISFVDDLSATRWMVGVKRNVEAGKLGYMISGQMVTTKR